MNGWDVLLVIAGLLLLLLAERLWAWHRRVEMRRLQRRVEINMMRARGTGRAMSFTARERP